MKTWRKKLCFALHYNLKKKVKSQYYIPEAFISNKNYKKRIVLRIHTKTSYMGHIWPLALSQKATFQHLTETFAKRTRGRHSAEE